jgi:hypothetical protein
MTADVISVSLCIALSGLDANEVVLGVTPTKRHDELYENYLFKLGKRYDALAGRIVGDIRASLDLGATRLAADLLIVLRLALAWRLKRVRRRGFASRARRSVKPSPHQIERNAVHFFAAERHAPRVLGALRCVRRSGDVHIVRGVPQPRGFILRRGGVWQPRGRNQ